MPRPLAIALASAIALVLALPAAASASTRYAVSSQTLSVRNAPADFVLGTLYGSASAGPNVGGTEHIDIQQRTRDGVWGYGLAYGHYGRWSGYRCGWVLMSGLRRTGGGGRDSCPTSSASRLDPRAIFAPGSVDLGCGYGCVRDAVIVRCAQPYAYGNYDPSTGRFSNRYPGRLPPGRGTTGKHHRQVTSGYSGFGWRYQTADRRAVLIKDSRSPGGGRYPLPTWHFVRASCIGQIR